MSDEEKQKTFLACKTLQDFFHCFGNDIYAEILLEELFKGLMNEESLFIFGEQKQTGNQTDNSSSEQKSDEFNNIRHEGTKPPHILGEEDFSDYP